MFVAERSSIRRIDMTTGVVDTIAGTHNTYQTSGAGGPAVDALFRSARTVRVNDDNEIYVVAADSQWIFKFVPGGTLELVIGDPSGAWGYSFDETYASEARINTPQGVAFAGECGLVFGDHGGGVARVRLAGSLTCDSRMTC